MRKFVVTSLYPKITAGYIIDFEKFAIKPKPSYGHNLAYFSQPKVFTLANNISLNIF